jgi:hypothetical protein
MGGLWVEPVLRHELHVTTASSAAVARHFGVLNHLKDTSSHRAGCGSPSNRRFFGVMAAGMVCVRTR